jgi:hypothetical protein
LIYPIKLIRKIETFSPSSSRVGPDVGGLIPKEEKVEEEVPEGA